MSRVNQTADDLLERLEQAEHSRDELALRSKRLERENRQLRARVEAVERSIAAMTGGRGGPASPQVDDPGQTLIDAVVDQVDGDAQVAESPTADDAQKKRDRRKTSKHKRGGRLKALRLNDLETREIVIDVPEDERLGPDGNPLPVVGVQADSTLAYEPGRYYHRRVLRPVYGLLDDDRLPLIFRDPEPRIIAGGQVDDSVLIGSFIACFADHLPVYRQERQAARQQIPLTRATLCRWMNRLARFLEPIADTIGASVMREPVLHLDDTTFRLIEPADPQRKKAGQTHLGRIWAIASDEEAWYQYTDTREGHWMNTLLSDFQGYVVGDDYRGHSKLLQRAAITAVFCWAHVLRKFRDCADTRDAPAICGLIGELYRIEERLAEHPPDERLAIRQSEAQPILDQLDQHIDDLIPRTTPKQDLGNAVRYTQRLRDGLRQFLVDGRVPLDNNTCERAMRRVAVNRKNRLFAVSELGAEANAVGFTIIESCHRAQIDPARYLADVVRRLHAGAQDYDALRPARWTAPT